MVENCQILNIMVIATEWLMSSDSVYTSHSIRVWRFMDQDPPLFVDSTKQAMLKCYKRNY